MKLLRFALLFGLTLFLSTAAAAQSTPQKPRVPRADGDAGECALAIDAINVHGEPVANVKLELNATYGGFLSKHALDLTVTTDQQGKAVFVGLPDKTDGVAFVRASTGELKGIAVFDPENGCTNKHVIIMTPGVGLARTEAEQ